MLLSNKEINEAVNIMLVGNLKAYQNFMDEVMSRNPSAKDMREVNQILYGKFMVAFAKVKLELEWDEFEKYMADMMRFSIECAEWYVNAYPEQYATHVREIDPQADPIDAYQDFEDKVNDFIDSINDNAGE